MSSPQKVFQLALIKKFFGFAVKGMNGKLKSTAALGLEAIALTAVVGLRLQGKHYSIFFHRSKLSGSTTKMSLDPSILHPGSPQKAHWRCSNGHTYQKAIRVTNCRLKTGCRECNSFGFNFPEEAKTWHPKNDKVA